MIRYLAIATALVVGAVVLILAAGERFSFDTNVGGHAIAGMTPSPATSGAAAAASARAGGFRGEAAWALGALPECYHETMMERDRPATVARAEPPVDVALPAGSRVRTGDCTIGVASGGLTIRRADDVFVVPGVARFYVARDAARGDTLVLVRATGGLEMRRYAFRAPTTLERPSHAVLKLRPLACPCRPSPHPWVAPPDPSPATTPFDLRQ